MQALVEFCKYGFYILTMGMLVTPSATLTQSFVESGSSASSNCVSYLSVAVLLASFFESIGLTILGYLKIQRHIIGAERMEEQANDHQCDSNPESMKGYKHVVLQRPICIIDHLVRKQGRSITIEQIWDCCGNSADSKALKDLCLSFVLYQQLLEWRYFGQVCPEASLLKANDLVFKKLLLSEGDFKRAFSIIEAELGFCYDFFFTKYQYTFLSMESLVPLIPFLVLLKIILILTVGVFAFGKSLVLETPRPIIEVRGTETDYIITLLVLGIVLVMELAQAAFYLASDWVQVSLACRHVKKNCNAANAFIGRVIGFLRRIIISGALRDKIGQYSVIRMERIGPAEVSDAVKGAIARSLIRSNGNLTNGETLIRNNQRFEKCYWAFKNHSQLEVMFIWHIATEYCDISDDQTNGITPDNDRGVAVCLSKYCAYLIGSVPELLPYHEVDIRELTTKVAKERKQLFGSYKDSEVYDKMKKLDGTEEGDDPATVFKKGVKLGKQLASMTDVLERWKMMEDFWAQTILYVAPAHSTAKQHMQHLENGGEFLTHIWALLSHAGILNLNSDKDQGAQAEPASV
ncbi:unnamed protein product [Triticum turgidum subsp. durum]|uniref:DUF4220 domain-containing protein n=1 Tax=Triticum turgidum subsp. durum TaxID=4567 RepID=A0A9R1NJA2_TRITD|nr:unnamed protein product [Triticum turgidum subsp. durum]